MQSAIIIGGGPAGCQCALWLNMLGLQTILIEQNNQLGGLQIISPYKNNWLVGTLNLSGQEIARNMQTHLEQMQIPIIFNSTPSAIQKNSHGFFEVTVNNQVFKTQTVVIATGVQAKSDGFIKSSKVFIGPGDKIHNFNFANKKIAIFGGGDNAAENYTFIKKQNPSICHVYARTIRARQSLWQMLNPSDIFHGKYSAQQKTMSVIFQDQEYFYDIFVVMYGWEANIPLALRPFAKDLLDENGFIFTDELRQTKIPKLFAIGEVTKRTHPCVATSMADGVIAAQAVSDSSRDPV